MPGKSGIYVQLAVDEDAEMEDDNDEQDEASAPELYLIPEAADTGGPQQWLYGMCGSIAGAVLQCLLKSLRVQCRTSSRPCVKQQP